MNKPKQQESFVWHYHQTTKHQLSQFVNGPSTLDRDDQPEAFRWFEGAPKINLPLCADALTTR